MFQSSNRESDSTTHTHVEVTVTFSAIAPGSGLPPTMPWLQIITRFPLRTDETLRDEVFSFLRESIERCNFPAQEGADFDTLVRTWGAEFSG
jgi:hypothetical protein